MICRSVTTVAVAAVCLAAAPVRTAPPHPPALDVPPLSLLPDAPLSSSEFDHLAKTDPVALLAACVHHYRATNRGFTATLHKQERIAGTLYKPERVRVTVREVPYAVRMIWEEGAREVKLGPISLGTVEGVVYGGTNDGQMTVWRPAARFGKTMPIGPTGDQARAAARYSVTEAGVCQAAERTLKAWSEAKRQGKLTWRYVGTKPVPELGDRVCHVIERTCDPVEVDPFLSSERRPDAAKSPADAFRTVTVMIDAEHRIQVGSQLKRADGELVGAYFFRDLDLNPNLDATLFKPTSFKK